MYTTAAERKGTKAKPVKNSIRFQLFGGKKALPAGASPLNKKILGWNLFFEKKVTLPGNIVKVLTFVP